MNEKKIFAGIIGFGYMGNFHLNRMRKVDGIEAYAAYDLDDTKLVDAESEGLVTYRSLDDFLNDKKIDLVVIATPNDVHAELAIRSLEKGKHVLCEKPATMNVDELRKVLDVANKNARIFTTHQNRRWDCDYKVVQQVVNERLIGQVTTIISQTFGQRGVCFGWRADDKKGGGMLYDWGIHLVDQLLVLFENFKVISVYSRLRSILTPIVDDYFELELEFENDIIAHISVGTFALQETPRWYVFGDKGTLKLDDFSGKKGGIKKIKDNIRGFNRVHPDKILGPSRTMAHLEKENIEEIELPQVEETPFEFYENLVSAIRGETEQCVTQNQMLRAMKVIQAAFESSEKKERVFINI